MEMGVGGTPLLGAVGQVEDAAQLVPGGGGAAGDDADVLATVVAVTVGLFAAVFIMLVCVLRRTVALLGGTGGGVRFDAAPAPDNLVLVYTSKNNLLEGAEQMDQLSFDEDGDVGRIV